MPLESLVPYFRGGRFAVQSIKRRHGGDERLVADADRYIALVIRYMEVARATFRLHRERDASPPA
ncbi:MAG: hypothetical protein ACREPA_08470 [Candidatus Dormibacteraceae bacterium]